MMRSGVSLDDFASDNEDFCDSVRNAARVFMGAVPLD